MKEVIYIEYADKENIHPNIMLNNRYVQFTDKLKRYPDSLTVSSDNSLQATSTKKQG